MTKMLLAEDEPHLREGIAFALREAGHEVFEARDGDEASVRLESEGIFDMLLTDIKMPGRDGIEVLKRAKMINESTVVIVMTAHGTVEGAVQAMQLGAYDYIQKPFTLDALEIKVRRALEHGRLVRTLLSLRPAEGPGEAFLTRLALGPEEGRSPALRAAIPAWCLGPIPS